MGLKVEHRRPWSLAERVIQRTRRLVNVVAIVLVAGAVAGGLITYLQAESSGSEWNLLPWQLLALAGLALPMVRDITETEIKVRRASRGLDGYCPHCGFDMRGIAGECRSCHEHVEELCRGMTGATRKGERALLEAVLISITVVLLGLVMAVITVIRDRSGWTLLFLAILVVFLVHGLIGSAVRTRRWEQRLREDRCPRCNFDCRATPGRCPECGLGRPYDEDEQPAP